MLIWLVCLLLCTVLSLSNLQITLALYFYTVEYLMYHKIFCIRGSLLIFYLIICLFYLLHHNEVNKSKNHPSSFVYYLLFIKQNFVFTLKNSDPAKTWPTGPTLLSLYRLADTWTIVVRAMVMHNYSQDFFVTSWSWY